MRRRSLDHAFTLIEILAVIVVVAVIAGAVGLTFTYGVRAATDRDFLDRIVALDEVTRRAARQGGQPMRLAFDLEHGLVRQQDGEGQDTGQRVRAPRGMVIRRLVTVDIDAQYGDAGVAVSTIGTSETYAVFVGRDDQPAVGVLFAGLTGQVTRLTDERTAKDILATIDSPALATSRPDAR